MFYPHSDSWAGFLTAGDHVQMEWSNVDADPSETSEPAKVDSVFYCPAAEPEIQDPAAADPELRFTLGTRHWSQPNEHYIDSWYTVNTLGFWDSTGNKAHTRYPFRTLDVAAAASDPTSTSKVFQIPNASGVIAVYEGPINWGHYDRVPEKSRHGDLDAGNYSFIDGHATTINMGGFDAYGGATPLEPMWDFNVYRRITDAMGGADWRIDLP